MQPVQFRNSHLSAVAARCGLTSPTRGLAWPAPDPITSASAHDTSGSCVQPSRPFVSRLLNPGGCLPISAPCSVLALFSVQVSCALFSRFSQSIRTHFWSGLPRQLIFDSMFIIKPSAHNRHWIHNTAHFSLSTQHRFYSNSNCTRTLHSVHTPFSPVCSSSVT